MTQEDGGWAELGNQLREERKYRGYSQEEVAKYLGESPSFVALLESGNKKVDRDKTRKLERLFNIDLCDLGNGDKIADEASEEVELLARKSRELSNEDREEVWRFVDFLKSRQSRGSGND